MRTQWLLLCALIFALITAIFAVINVEPVKVNFLFTVTNTPLILVIMSSTVLGGLIVGSFGILRQYRLQKTIRNLEKQLQEAGTSPEFVNSAENTQTVQPSSAENNTDRQL